MKRLILAAMALALVARPALADTIPGLSIKAPAGSLPAVAVYCDNGSGLSQICVFGSGGGGGGLGGSATTTAPTLTNGQTLTNFYFDLSGNLRTLATVSNTGFAINGALPAGEQHIGEIGGKSVVTGGTFTTPSGVTAYASGNLIANSATAGSVTPISVAACRVNSGSGMVRRIRYTTTDTGFAGAAVRVHLYRDTPTASNGDHAAWLTTQSTYIGAFDVTLDRHFTDAEKGVGAPVTGSEANFDCASGTQAIFALIEARGAITPQGAKAHTIALEIIQN